ncbi:MAG TPA: hypothetical protein VM143_08680 [Acidimicrobiales bacterium]|nr:hypothetical protein [Acidimicrobiales bacterium]
MVRATRGAAVVFVLAVALGSGSCAGPRLSRDGARSFTDDALRAAGLSGVVVRPTTTACTVEDVPGWRTLAETSAGEVSMCVSRDQGRALSVRDPGMTDAQFARLEAYRSGTATDRARPLAAASSGLLLVGVVAKLALVLADGGGR